MKASRAPVLQSSPTSLGKTTVLRPQGIQAIKTADGNTAEGNVLNIAIALQSANTRSGINTSLKAEKIYVFRSNASSFNEKEDNTSPVRIILIGPTQADEDETTCAIVSGRVISKSPKIIPMTIADVIGLRSFFNALSFLVSIAKPNVYVYTAKGMQKRIKLVSACVPRTFSINTYPIYE